MLLETAAGWLLGQVGGSLFNAAKQRLLEQMGISSPLLTKSGARVLLDDYYQRLVDASIRPVIARLDEDRLARLRSGIEQLKRSSKTAGLKQGVLISALNDFSYITSLPESGETANIPNRQLRCLAFLGIAAIHVAVNDAPNVIAENIAAAIYVDASIAEQWLGKKLVRELLIQNPTPVSSPLPGGYFNLMQKATGQYLDGNGSTVYPHHPNRGVYQDWKAIEVSPNVIQLQHRQSGKLLDAAPGREEAYLLPNNGGLYQQWSVEKVGDQGFFKLRQLATNMVLDAGTDGHAYILEDNGGDHQLWKIVSWRS